MLETLVTILHVTVCLFLVLVVLVQGGHSGGVGAAFGGEIPQVYSEPSERPPFWESSPMPRLESLCSQVSIL